MFDELLFAISFLFYVFLSVRLFCRPCRVFFPGYLDLWVRTFISSRLIIRTYGNFRVGFRISIPYSNVFELGHRFRVRFRLSTLYSSVYGLGHRFRVGFRICTLYSSVFGLGHRFRVGFRMPTLYSSVFGLDHHRECCVITTSVFDRSSWVLLVFSVSRFQVFTIV